MHKMVHPDSFIDGIPGFQDHTQSIYMDKLLLYILKEEPTNINDPEIQKISRKMLKPFLATLLSL